jgi:hypothetical protein
MAGDMIRVWNEPVVADFNAFYFVWRDRGGPQQPNNIWFLDTVQSKDNSGMRSGYQFYGMIYLTAVV